MLSLISRYFNWLQKDNPVGDVTLYPELSDTNETTAPGVYIVGDLTGLPLLKLATNKAVELIERFPKVDDLEAASPNFESLSAKDKDDEGRTVENYDLVIIGAGPAGIAAAIEAKKQGYTYIVLEATERLFGTIEDFPKGKPMFYEPPDLEEISELTMQGDTKEDLLEHLNTITKKHDLNIRFQQKVDDISNISGQENKVDTKDYSYLAKRMILSIGKTGNHRHLGIPGEDMDHVYYKLYDPGEFKGKDILVVGGGDSALEGAQLLAQAGNKVALSYRGKEFTRPKEGNVNKVKEMEKAGQMELVFESNLKEIREKDVDIDIAGKVEKRNFDVIFLMLGTELPYAFLEKAGIKIENTFTKMTWWWVAFVFSFANIVYFGKLSSNVDYNSGLSGIISSVFAGDLATIIPKLFAWLSVAVLLISGVVCVFDVIINAKRYFKNNWAIIKNTYFLIAMTVFLIAFSGNKYFDYNLGGKDPYFWYSLLYTVTIGFFGFRRIMVWNKKYVTYQTITVFLIQAIPLFLIPNFILPWMNDAGMLSPWVIENVFLGGEWWRFVGFILAWPLFIWNVLTDEPSTFWLVVSLIQTFVIIPFIVIKWGKGAYCSWICSCGAMAETLGDEYRTLMWHGPKAKKWDNLGQVILFSIFGVTIVHMLGWHPSLSDTLAGIDETLVKGYQMIVDTFLAGSIGIGMYFFFSGRVWCRFACPLAALMHVYNKYQRWGILADKKKCISCGLCTKYCHMGIDVMSYAQRGKTVDDVECVNCSACVHICPTEVLRFGEYRKGMLEILKGANKLD